MNKPFVNNQIRAAQVRVIDGDGKQLGILTLSEALQMAKERNLDLVQVTGKVDPPVCKITEYGKYLYWLQKKERGSQVKKGGELKGIRLTFNISPHDMETRANLADKFLKEGDKIRLEMVLRGREKGLLDFAKGKINQFLEILGKKIPIKIERALKKESKGFSMIIAKS
ncbi:MAG: translation initiation factor IF-3 [Candidatus Wildermuthbacteria bacterium]|nr:translation initiation factor IF-3 [Candidatus Wildermuthbacteria bacterium]